MDEFFSADIEDEARRRHKEDFLDLTNDALFKYLFANNAHKDLTISLLNSLLDFELKHEIKNLEFLSTEIGADKEDGKSCRLDVLCELDSGEQVNIEMQRIDNHNMFKRSLDYWASCYKGQLEKGDDYNLHLPVICINILNYEIFKWRKSYFNLAALHFENPDERISDELRLLFIELPKLQNIIQNKNWSKREYWLKLLDPSVPFAEKEKFAMNDVAMSGAIELTKRFSGDYLQRMRYVFEERAERDRISEINYAKKETTEENALSLMRNGANLDLITKSLGYSREELLELAKANNITVKE